MEKPERTLSCFSNIGKLDGTFSSTRNLSTREERNSRKLITVEEWFANLSKCPYDREK